MANSAKSSWAKRLLLLYGITLVCSWLFQLFASIEPKKLDAQLERIVEAKTEGGEGLETIKIRYFDTVKGVTDNRPILLLLHGSPMASSSFDTLNPYLDDYRLIVPDLPGFGRSQKDLRSYSVKSHAVAMEVLLDELDIERVHVVGYSMGGGVALEMISLNSERIQSLTLLSAIGVQEYELLGDYSLNHSIHAIQLAGLKLLEWVTPHFGYWHHLLLNSQYARNFYDTDQRPLEDIIRNYDGPALIVHGEDDFMVPVEAAEEHARLMPQADVALFAEEGHIVMMTDPETVAEELIHFVDAVESGKSERRSDVPEIVGTPIERKNSDVFIAVLLGIATFGSEDLACIGAGLLAAKGGVSLLYAILGTFFGIFIGDYFIYLGGRIMGRTALKVPPFKWMLSPKKIEQGEKWFNEKGILLVIATRFLPGSRVPTYFAAGVVKANPLSFAFALLIAAGVWTPILVGLSYYFGGSFIKKFEESGGSFLLMALVLVIVFTVLLRLGMASLTWKGRRLLYSKFQRTIRWEFWPTWALYPPVVLYIGWLMLKYRSITLCTGLNPCMPSSGLVFESKSQILQHLDRFSAPVGRFAVIELEDSADQKIENIKCFLAANELDYPIVLKPDVGQRGAGVAIVRSETEAREFLQTQVEDTIAQEYISGNEYGVFYYRLPNDKKGHVMSVTDKRFTQVIGDGVSNLEALILKDARAVCMAKFFLDKFEDRLEFVPQKGEAFTLADLGTHCKGAMFLDGEELITPALVDAVDAFSSKVEGFYFGRYDVRVPSPEHLKRGEGIKLIELNGLTSESTNMYDPKHGLFFAYKTLTAQWALIFRISSENRKRGVQADSLWATIRLLAGYLSGKSAKELLADR